MQSSFARMFSAASVAALALSVLPVPIATDALTPLVSATLPPPIFTSLSSVVAQAQTLATSTTPTITTSNVVMKTPPKAPATAKTTYPRLVIPAINLNDPIIDVGVDSTGAMAVPNGKTDEVGWYDGGPKPGDVGSAVLDAHVFAAFSKLNELKSGDSIYVEESATQTLHFIVTNTVTFPLSQITSEDLFTPTSNRDLNLITCAGNLTPDHSTYDHRFVVYSKLVN